MQYCINMYRDLRPHHLLVHNCRSVFNSSAGFTKLPVCWQLLLQVKKYQVSALVVTMSTWQQYIVGTSIQLNCECRSNLKKMTKSFCQNFLHYSLYLMNTNCEPGWKIDCKTYSIVANANCNKTRQNLLYSRVYCTLYMIDICYSELNKYHQRNLQWYYCCHGCLKLHMIHRTIKCRQNLLLLSVLQVSVFQWM